MRAMAYILAGLVSLVGLVSSAFAAQPTDWGIWHQEAGSDMMAQIEWFDAYTFWFITPITIFVLLLLIIVMVRFNSSKNPNPSKTTHNTAIEVVWTVVPIIVLIAIVASKYR